jgi:hypothetical protein
MHTKDAPEGSALSHTHEKKHDICKHDSEILICYDKRMRKKKASC